MFDLTLSFDNGPTPDVTPLVLDVLARRGVRSTFFVIGEKLDRPGHRALAERAHTEGHWIGNHTWSHSLPFGLMAADAAKSEFDRTQDAIGSLVHAHRYFRPYGQGGNLDNRLLSRDVVAHLASQRATLVLWSALPRDWNDPDGWVERALGQVAVRPWSLMVLHDLPTGAMRHLDRFLGLIEDRGGRIRQDFPPDCTPMVDGEMRFGTEEYVAA
ncbi:MAG: peptidoglycan-N-acetylglucosamine deacetylase [Hyphomicrobiales bacterium]|nr:peptidoglycan-N-acetylglucosamine deacetylase [Hyphomicrobiales bacterium]